MTPIADPPLPPEAIHGSSAAPCSACRGSGLGKPMYRPEIARTQRDRCYTCKGTGKKSEGNAMFDPDILARAVMDSETAEAFRLESRKVILRDEITDARVVCYRHPDGRVLVDAIRLPNAEVSRGDGSASQPQEKS